jgi:hypothetical protein
MGPRDITATSSLNPLRVCSESAPSVLRVCSESSPSLLRAFSESAPSLLRVTNRVFSASESAPSLPLASSPGPDTPQSSARRVTASRDHPHIRIRGHAARRAVAPVAVRRPARPAGDRPAESQTPSRTRTCAACGPRRRRLGLGRVRT